MEAVDPTVFRLAIFVLAIFVGYYVVWSVTPALPTPLMAGTNAISSVITRGRLGGGHGGVDGGGGGDRRHGGRADRPGGGDDRHAAAGGGVPQPGRHGRLPGGRRRDPHAGRLRHPGPRRGGAAEVADRAVAG